MFINIIRYVTKMSDTEEDTEKELSYYERNREARKAYSKAYYRKNIATVADYQTNYRANPDNKERAKEAQRLWRLNNPEKIKGYKLKYKKEKENK